MSEEQQKTTFDQRLTRLEEIVNELEGGGVDLEPAIDRYKEGVSLIKSCTELLSGYRKQVEELSREADGELRAYAGDPDIDSESGS